MHHLRSTSSANTAAVQKGTSIPSLAGASVSLLISGSDGLPRAQSFAAGSVPEAIRMAAAQGLVVVGIVQQEARQTVRGGTKRFPLLLFSQELLALLDAGLNLTEALSTLHLKERQPLPASVLLTILTALREGKNFSDILATMPEHFPNVYVATVKASERTGDLPRALGRYIAYQLQFELIRKKLISASIYPVMLLVVGGFVTLFLLGYVVPRFSVVYESAGRELPWLSTMLLAMGKLIYANWQIVLAGFIGLLVLTGWGVTQPRGRQVLLNGLLRFPFVAAKSDEFRLSRFYRAVGLLLAAGISLPKAMGLVEGLLSASQQTRLNAARLSIEHGQSLSHALGAAQLSSPVADSLIKVGERSGQMADMLERAARFHDEDFARWVDWASKLLEPLLMTLIGVFIGTIVVLMYMPIFDLAGGLQ